MKELEDLRARLADAEEVVRAIRAGEVDAVVVAGDRGEQVYTLSGADRVYRQIIEGMSEGAVSLSAGGIILYANACMSRMLGRPLDQLLGTAFRGHLPPGDRETLDQVLADASAAPIRRELSLTTGEGGLVPVYLAASRLQGDAAETVFSLVLTDLTEVRMRTAQVEAANADLETFTGSVSHDLKAPLRSIARYLGRLHENWGPTMPPECRSDIETMQARVEAMRRLIEDLLAFSRLGRQTMSRSAVSMDALVREVIDSLRDQLGGRAVSFEVGRLAPCEGDPALLTQVWVNLLSNALKFTRGAKQAVIEIGSRDEAGETVYRVKDNGAGFDMRQVDRIFKEFQRLHTAEEYEGTGLGLSIVARIVERHGGRIWARSELGHGAEFLFTVGGK